MGSRYKVKEMDESEVRSIEDELWYYIDDLYYVMTSDCFFRGDIDLQCVRNEVAVMVHDILVEFGLEKLAEAVLLCFSG